MSQWRRRWFTVKRAYDAEMHEWVLSLCWHKDHNSAAIRAVPIECLASVSVAGPASGLTFKIVVQSVDGAKKRAILLKAESAEQMKLWVDSLNAMIEEVRERLKSEFLNNRPSSVASVSVARRTMQSSGSLSFVDEDEEEEEGIKVGGGESKQPLPGTSASKDSIGELPSTRNRRTRSGSGRGKSKRTSIMALPSSPMLLSPGTVTGSPALLRKSSFCAVAEGAHKKKSPVGGIQEEKDAASSPSAALRGPGVSAGTKEAFGFAGFDGSSGDGWGVPEAKEDEKKKDDVGFDEKPSIMAKQGGCGCVIA